MIQNILFKLKEIIYRKILKKDTMELRIQLYRDKGAKIGKCVRSFSPIESSEPYLIEIGDYVTISVGVKFITHDNSATKIIKDSTDLIGKIKIGNNCFIGVNTLLMPGITIGDSVIIGAGSVVTRSFFEDGIIIAGNPAKKIATIEEYKNKYNDYTFNLLGMSYQEKKELILNNEKKILEK